jgi:hypothetical protein
MSSGRIVDAGEFSSATLNRRMMLMRFLETGERLTSVHSVSSLARLGGL